MDEWWRLVISTGINCSLDALSLDSDQHTFMLYLWSHADFTFQLAHTFKHPSKVLNVVPGDYTHNGKLDILVMSESQTRDTLDLAVYPALPAGGFDTSNVLSVPSSATAQPLLVDINGDMKVDLLGMTPSSRDDSQSPLKVWKNVWNASEEDSSLFNIEDPRFSGSQCKISNPHSNAVIDLNGDCLADLFLVCDNGRNGKSFQIWINNKEDGFSLVQQGSLPSDLQSISFSDMDRDGTIDFVFTTCSHVSSSTGIGSDCYINIAYNKQLKLCSSTTDTGFKNGVRVCRPPDDLCTPDSNFSFDLSDRADNDAFVRFPFSTLFSNGQAASLLVQDTTYSPPLPIPIKLGDANLDGFPDFLFIAAIGNDRTPNLAFSVPCAKGVAGCKADGSGRRGWVLARKGAEMLQYVTDARSVSFLDMDEDGTLDLMIQRTGDSKQGHVLFIQNNFYYDAFFMKAIVLNGACGSGWCYNTNGSRYHPFGVSYPGASYKYTILDTSGHRSAAQVGQLSQTSYHALNTPYTFFGLGRTNNYIENLFVGSTLHSQQHYIDLEGVIPNSKLVILPAEEGEMWKRQLFLRPGEWIPWVTVTMLAGTVVLAIIVFMLRLNEKREDELERRKASHHINFDAL
ncbi:hypothetical protein AX16_002884 [Volvariella volvacea WC 439]|nr:hypothetical protein AX16_002884 [Volvariella volvacea WC 439]